MEVTLPVILVSLGTAIWLRRSFIFLLLTMMCLPHLASAGLVDVLTPITVTISTRNFNDASLICGVPMCDANSPNPLINIVIEADAYPPFSAVNEIYNVPSGAITQNGGYISFIGLDASALDHVVIGLRNGFVNVGDLWPFAVPESNIASDLLTGGAAANADLQSFFLSNLTAFPQILGDGGTLYEFSGASIVGTEGQSTITPEPSAMILTLAPLLTIIILSRRGKTRVRSAGLPSPTRLG